MGGSKNKSPAKKEKVQKADSKKSKKPKTEGGAPKAEITVILTKEQAAGTLKGAKVITVQELARRTGVKTSAANAYLREAVKDGSMKIIGGKSGHRIYQPASA